MERKLDADGFTIPTPPISAGSGLYQASVMDRVTASNSAPSVAQSAISGSSSGWSRKPLVENPFYRHQNLAANNIYIRSSRGSWPEYISDLADHLRRDRGSPGPSVDEVWHDADLESLEMGTAENKVEDYFKEKIFRRSALSGGLERVDKIPMARHVVPDTATNLFGLTRKISNPVPDMLYGYDSLGAFPQQQLQLNLMGDETFANSQYLLYPFLVVEFKANGPGVNGSMWVATNQCVGGSTSCVNIIERLNHRLKQCQTENVRPVNSVAFSIAMNGTEARLYISWKQDELTYYMTKIRSFLLQDPEHYLEFRKYVLSILDWGRDERLKDIQEALDSLLEDRGIASSSQQDKSRPTPSAAKSMKTGDVKRKRSLSGERSGKEAKSVRENP
ncbi:hypothetical protein MMC09_002827 [Bachmanniomyces sp. S44760]|nr:hypothetical protein [Bachmanniomyces sp. S44760]